MGEACGLDRADVDLDAGVLTVRAATEVPRLQAPSRSLTGQPGSGLVVTRPDHAFVPFPQARDQFRLIVCPSSAEVRPGKRAAATEDHNDIVHILTVKLRQERDARRNAVSDLETQLAAAHGELLRLRLLHEHGVRTG